MKAYDATYRAVLEHIERLIDSETYDEKSHAGEVLEACHAQMKLRFDDTSAWGEAFENAPYDEKWHDAVAVVDIFDGDDAALGKMLRESAVRSLAADIFRIAGKQVFV